MSYLFQNIKHDQMGGQRGLVWEWGPEPEKRLLVKSLSFIHVSFLSQIWRTLEKSHLNRAVDVAVRRQDHQLHSIIMWSRKWALKTDRGQLSTFIWINLSYHSRYIIKTCFQCFILKTDFKWINLKCQVETIPNLENVGCCVKWKQLNAVVWKSIETHQIPVEGCWVARHEKEYIRLWTGGGDIAYVTKWL